MSQDPRSITVSVHIVTFNSAATVDECLRSVTQQTYPVGTIVVVDNDSADGTLEILRSYANRIVLHQNSVNKGFAEAHNQAMDLSNEDFFLVLNPDVILHPDYVRCLIHGVGHLNSVGSVTGMLLSSGTPHLVDSVGIEMRRNRRAMDRGSNTPRDMWCVPAEVFGVSGAAALYSRRMSQDITIDGEFFDKTFFAYKEDVDVAWRARLFGWSAHYVPDAIAFHERGWKIGKRRNMAMAVRQYSYINRYRMLYKNGQIQCLVKDFWPIAAYEAASFAYSLVREPHLLAKWPEFWKDIRRLTNHRRRIQARRKATGADIRQFLT